MFYVTSLNGIAVCSVCLLNMLPFMGLSCSHWCEGKNNLSGTIACVCVEVGEADLKGGMCSSEQHFQYLAPFIQRVLWEQIGRWQDYPWCGLSGCGDVIAYQRLGVGAVVLL